MENNEDKRTPIQAEIERQKTLADEAGVSGHHHLYTITVLQSLLEPEKEALIKARGFTGTEWAEAWFASTYTQQTK